MRSLCRAALLLAAVALVGCDRDATQLTAPINAPAGAHRDVVAQVVAPHLTGAQNNICGLHVDGSIACWGSEATLNGPPGGAFVQFEAGTSNACALTATGAAACWGLAPSWFAPPSLPAGMTYLQISAGQYTACAVRSDNSIGCWGFDVSGSPKTGVPTGGFTAVSVGRQHACAITTAGAITCWGTDLESQISNAPATPAGRRFTQIEAGTVHTCAVLDDGSAQCWGNNKNGQLNVPALPAGMKYVRVVANASVGTISATTYFSCALRSDGAVLCWGSNFSGQLNVAALPSGLAYTDVAVGNANSCAVRSDGVVVCWGLNTSGQSTVPSTLNLLKGTQSVSFSQALPSEVGVGSALTLIAGSAGTPLVLASTTPTTCTIGGTKISFVAIGTCTFTGNRAGDANFEPAAQATFTINVVKSQTITFTSTAPSGAHVSDTYTVSATGGGSGNPVTFSSQSPATCTMSGSVATFIAAGNCVIAADQAASPGYGAAPRVSQTIVVTRRSQAIVFTLPPQDTIGATVALAANGGASGNPVTYTVYSPTICSIVNGKLTLKAIGPCNVAADQAGNVAYDAAPRVGASIIVRYPFLLDAGLVAPPALNRGKAGHRVDITFSLGADRGLNIFHAGTTLAAAYTCGTTPPSPLVGTAQPASASTLTYDTRRQRYVYAWTPDAAWGGKCVRLSLTLDDGSFHTVLFDFK